MKFGFRIPSLKKLIKSSKNKQIEGSIAYYQLQDWWFQEFTEQERKTIEDLYKPMWVNKDEKSLTEGKVLGSSQSVMMFLVVLSGWFNNPLNRSLANRIISKANQLAQDGKGDILDKHFLYSEMVSVFYPQRQQKDNLNKTIEACKKQISLTSKAAKAFKGKYPKQELPSHKGYEQLVIILDKQGNQKEAIVLCEQAKEQGWAGDWDKRINRYRQKL